MDHLEFINGKIRLYGILDNLYLNHIHDSFPLGAYTVSLNVVYFNARYIEYPNPRTIPYIHLEPFYANPKSQKNIFFKQLHPMFVHNTAAVAAEASSLQKKRKRTQQTESGGGGCDTRRAACYAKTSITQSTIPVASTSSAAAAPRPQHNLTPEENAWFRQYFNNQDYAPFKAEIQNLDPQQIAKAQQSVEHALKQPDVTPSLQHHLAEMQMELQVLKEELRKLTSF